MIARILVQIIVTFARFESSNSSNNGADCRFSGYSCSPFSLASLPPSLSLQPLSTSPPSFPLERSSKDLGRPRGESETVLAGTHEVERGFAGNC